MANREKGEASVEIGGVSYTLTISTNALCEIETLFSTDEKLVTFQEVLKRAEAGSVAAVRGLLWAMLRDKHPDVTVKQAGGLIDKIGAAELSKHLAQLSGHALPDPKDVKEAGPTATGNPRRARAVAAGGTGTPSSDTRGASV